MKSTKKAWVHTPTHVPWDDLQIFLAVAEAGSLSGAAQRLRITQPTVSRRVADLEARLGEPLFVRSSDGVVITAYAERLLEPARRMAEWAAEVDRAAERKDVAPEGLVRVTAPPGVAWEILVPFAAELREELPQVRLEVIATVANLDLSRREADLALRLAAPSQRDLVSVASLEHEVGAFAAAAYVKKLPRRYGVGDVAWLAWAGALDHLSPNPELARMIPGFRPSFATDDFLVMMRAAQMGLGAIFLARTRSRYLEEHDLVELDLDLGHMTRTMHLACAKSALSVPRIRAVADRLARVFDETVRLPRRRRSHGRA